MYTLSYEGLADSYDEEDQIPDTENPAFVLGHAYSCLYDRAEIHDDIRSRIWCTYRKGFQPIRGSDKISDAGWGCMLRCGQMLIANTLLNLHLGRHWRWRKGESTNYIYMKILSLVADNKDATYSVHQIAWTGESEGKSVGSWFGPNTVAQVLKKLAVYDSWSNLVVHVAMDNLVVLDEIINRCESVASRNGQCEWRPLLLIVPLRLGLTDLNPTYIKPLKACFEWPQACGVLGGRPNHACWFVGYVDNELFYLDPHVIQPVVDFPNELYLGTLNAVRFASLSSQVDDASFHCPVMSRMAFSKLDPSLAVTFLCRSRADLDDLAARVRHYGRSFLFEVCDHEPSRYYESSLVTSVSVPVGSPDATVSLADDTAGSSRRQASLSVTDDSFENVEFAHRESEHSEARAKDNERLVNTYVADPLAAFAICSQISTSRQNSKASRQSVEDRRRNTTDFDDSDDEFEII